MSGIWKVSMCVYDMQMYVYICICIYVLYIYICMYVCKFGKEVEESCQASGRYLCAYMMYRCMCVCMYIYVYICMRVYDIQIYM